MILGSNQPALYWLHLRTDGYRSERVIKRGLAMRKQRGVNWWRVLT
jgi:hypothetical protein